MKQISCNSRFFHIITYMQVKQLLKQEKMLEEISLQEEGKLF